MTGERPFGDTPWKREFNVVYDAVIKAGMICERIATDNAINTATKSDDSPVTLADYASQHIIVSAIQNVFPSDAIIAEEDFTILSVEQQSQLANYVSGDLSQYPKATSESHRFWTIDPIDGTKGFIRNGQYAVCVALVEERQVILSLLNCPRLPNHNGTIGTLFVAMKGFGCFEIDTNGHHRHLNAHRARSEVEGAILAESYEANHSDHDLSRKMTTILKLNPEPIRMDSQCKYGLVARGDAHVYIRCPKKGYSERIWDHAPGCLIVEEAGGKVTDFSGESLCFEPSAKLFTSGGILATRLTVDGHELVLQQLQ